jgi:hypothetical protein
MTRERIGEEEQEPNGVHYLRLLDLEDLADRELRRRDGTPIVREDGTSVRAADFAEVCGEQALPMLVGLEAMDADDPRYEGLKGVLQRVVGGYIEGNNPS